MRQPRSIHVETLRLLTERVRPTDPVKEEAPLRHEDIEWIKMALNEIKGEVEELCSVKDDVQGVVSKVDGIKFPEPLDFTDRLNEINQSIAYVLSQLPKAPDLSALHQHTKTLAEIRERVSVKRPRKWRHTPLRNTSGVTLEYITEVID